MNSTPVQLQSTVNLAGAMDVREIAVGWTARSHIFVSPILSDFQTRAPVLRAFEFSVFLGTKLIVTIVPQLILSQNRTARLP